MSADDRPNLPNHGLGPVETARDAYARGVASGRVEVRLDHHDDQIASGAAMLDRLADISQINAGIVQTLTEARVTDAATRIATADAVKDAKETSEATAAAESAKAQTAEREAAAKAALGWSPITRMFAIIAAVAIIVNLYMNVSGRG